MDDNKRRPTRNKHEEYRENNTRRFRLALKISLRFPAVAPSLNLLLMKMNLYKNSQIAITHHDQRYQKARDSNQENITSVFCEGHFTHGVQRGASIFVPAQDWQNANDNRRGP